MHLERLHVEGFGLFHDYELTLGPGLNVLCGPNEAGKSTLLAFVQHVLFGFPDGRSRERTYPPLRGGRHGGRLFARDRAGQPWVVERFAGRHGGPLTLLLPDGSAGTQAELQVLLGQIPREAFCRVFAFGLGELQAFESLSDAAVQAHLYSAGTGGVRVAEVEQALAQRADQLFRPGARASKPAVNVLLKQLEDRSHELRALAGLPAEYDQALAERHGLLAAIAQQAQARTELGARLSHQQRLAEAWDDWRGLEETERSLQDLAWARSFPDDGQVRLQALAEKQDETAEALATLQREAEDTARRLALLEVDEALLSQAPQIDALASDRSRCEAEQQNLARAGQELESAAHALAAEVRALGPEWDEARLAAFDSSLPVREEVRQHRQDLEAAERQVSERLRAAQEAEQRLAETRQELEGLERAAEAAGSVDEAAHRRRQEAVRRLERQQERQASLAEQQAGLAAEAEAARRALAEDGAVDGDEHARRLRALQQVEARHGQEALLVEQQRALDAEQAAARGPSPRPTRVLAYTCGAIGLLLLVSGAALALSGRGGWAAVAAALGLLAAGWGALSLGRRARAGAAPAVGERVRRGVDAQLLEVGAALARASAVLGASEPLSAAQVPGARARLEQEARRLQRDQGLRLELEKLTSKVAALAAQRERHEGETREAAAILEVADALSSEALAEARARLEGEAQALQRQAARRDEIDRLAGVLQRRGEEADVADRGNEQAAAARADVLGRWQEWLAGRRLRASLSPDTALELLARVDAAREKARTLEDLRRRVQRLESSVRQYEERVQSVAAGRPPAADGPASVLSRVDRWVEEVKRARQADGQRTTLQQRLDEQRRHAAVHQEQLELHRQAESALLESAGVATRQELAAKGQAHRERAALVTRRDEHRRSLERLLGVGEQYAEGLRELAARSRADLDEEVRRLGEEGAARDGELASQREQLGRLSERIEGMETREEAAHLRLAQSVEQERLRVHAHEWALWKLAQALVAQTRAFYERERRPGVLREADAFFQRITRGAYVRIAAPLGQSAFAVVDRHGAQRQLGELSRGTAEQLYLALRLGLIRQLGRQAEPLPVVVDDILVNFDPERAATAVEALSELAAEHQVILLTCHPEVARMAQARGAAVGALPSSAAPPPSPGPSSSA